VTCVEDPTGSPPKVATACEANIVTAKAISLSYSFSIVSPKGSKKSVGAASCATDNADRTDCAAFGWGGGD
jgi:hypothetical protein